MLRLLDRLSPQTCSSVQRIDRDLQLSEIDTVVWITVCVGVAVCLMLETVSFPASRTDNCGNR